MPPINVPVPTQIVWASHHRATAREASFVLFDVIASKQKVTQFHVINRAGSLPSREQPAAFRYIVVSFGEGVRQEKAQMAARQSAAYAPVNPAVGHGQTRRHYIMMAENTADRPKRPRRGRRR